MILFLTLDWAIAQSAERIFNVTWNSYQKVLGNVLDIKAKLKMKG